MALVQSHGTGGVQPEQPHSGHPPPSTQLRQPAETDRAKPAGHEPSGGPSPPVSLSRRTYKGTLVGKRATKYLQITTSEGDHVEIKYHVNTPEALTSLFHLHLLDPPTGMAALKPPTVQAFLQQCAPSSAEIFCVSRSIAHRTAVPIEEPLLPFPLSLLIYRHQVFLIRDVSHVQKCDFCGRYFKQSHTCSARRRDFYFHHIHAQSSSWWEKIQFFPIGSCPTVQRLFITYDVETYTWHGKFGKQLVPFILVMHLSGDPGLVAEAEDLVTSLQWHRWDQAARTYYLLNPQKQAVGKAFKLFRDKLQQKMTARLWSHVLQENPQVETHCHDHGLSVDELTFEELRKIPLRGTPWFIEVYVVGHNINGFDEIVLAAQVINNKTDIPPVFKISRNFMPRCGKILFNDITFALPNPTYQTRKDYTLWEQGACEDKDFKHQFVKFMVRDTFALTHTSLRKAAAAYALPVEKGSCPYKAVNEFYMLGSYLQDEDGFPDAQYWQSPQEYAENKALWKKQECAYDIIQQTLDYCAKDVQVTAELVQKLQQSYQTFISQSVNLPTAQFNIFQRPTISSNSHAIFRQVLYRRQRPQKASLGDILQAPSCEMYDYVRESIRGGRCYPTYLGVLEEKIYVYDICGMYASALTHPFPVGRPLNPFDRALAVRTWAHRLSQRAPIDYFDTSLKPAIFTIDANPPDETLLDVLPPFCSRKSGRLCWTNEPLRGEVATSIDVITLHNRGWEVEILPDERTVVWPEWECIAREYVQLNIMAKEKADKENNQTIRSISKLLSNALYGSFATKLDNKKIVFADQMEDKYKQAVSTGEYSITASHFIETENLSAEIQPEFVVAYSPITTSHSEEDPQVTQTPLSDDEEDDEGALYSSADDVTYTYKPITFLDAEDGDMCLHTLEKNSPLIVNNKYPSQIASFVLAWTRAFVSEWAGFLYEEDRGIPLEQRTLKSVYGDTDSLFVTEAGHRLMETKGKARIKKNGGRLIFDPQCPALTWLVECETQCEKCGAAAYSSESVYLAPKLYALKDTTCEACGHVGKGKLRAKGHATSQLSYDLLMRCYYAATQEASERFSTSRLSLQRTLVSAQTQAQPFTVTEATLTRTLRPWQDMTLNRLDSHRLAPYSHSRPNPRGRDPCWMELPWNN
ncbi:DNA dependent DNA polymerase [Mastadenovirus porcusquartum]|uniref:DNA polymerase n=2 Tax=Mastadenovirus TaxID=10509 RepID=A0A7H0S569_9ADEN|nr:DNA dependent DNA polymerase [Porcine mastadenovirus B]QNQ79243.1 DNA dependent DNA polymerase [Porcine mastadenovirus B]